MKGGPCVVEQLSLSGCEDDAEWELTSTGGEVWRSCSRHLADVLREFKQSRELPVSVDYVGWND